MYFGIQRTSICLVTTSLIFSQLFGLALSAAPVHDSDLEVPADQIDGEGGGLDLFSFWDEVKNKVNELGDTVNTIVEDVGSSPIWSEVKNKANELGDTVNTIVEDVGSSQIWSEVKNKANELGDTVNTIVEDVGSSQIWSKVDNLANEIGLNKLLNETVPPEVQTFITSLQNEITSILNSQALQNLRSELESLNPNLNFNDSQSSDSNEFFIKFENEFQTRMDSRSDFLQQGFGSDTLDDIDLDCNAGPGRDQKVEFIGALVDVVGEVLVNVTKEFGVKEEQTREGFAVVKPAIKTILIIIADIKCFLDQHPWLEPLILGVLGVLIELLLSQIFPINIILRLLGFSLTGPVKGSFAAWAERVIFAGSVPKGSWFAFLQKMAMKGMKG